MTQATFQVPLVSVIVPVFNGSSFLLDLVRNVFAQNYPNIELILVDDGSSDDTVALGKQLESSSANIHFFANIHSGIGKTRNFGIAHASGKYVTFLDQDDCPDKNNLRLTIPILEASGAQAIFFRYAEIRKGCETEKELNFPDEGVMEGEEALRLFFERRFSGLVWAGVYDKSFLLVNNIFFDEHYRVIDDIDFIHKLLCRAIRVSFLPKVLYRWLINADSESHKNFSEPGQDILKLCNEVLCVTAKERIGLLNDAKGYCLDRLIYHYQLVYLHLSESDRLLLKKMQRRIREILRTTQVRKLNLPKASILKCYLFRMHLFEPSIWLKKILDSCHI